MSIIRRRRENNYTIVPNAILEDDRMSFEARGLLAYILTRPDHWQIHINHLRKVTGYGRDKCQRLVREILENGYGRRELKQDADGQFSGQELVFYDEVYMEAPEPEIQLDGDRKPETPEPENPAAGKSGPIVITETEVVITDSSNRRGSRLPKEWVPSDQGKDFAQEHGVDWKKELLVFRDYWVAKPGQGGVKLDWEATWRNWIRKAGKGRAKTGAEKIREALRG